MIKAIIFDLDGTLINSLEDIANSANFALKQLGYQVHNIEEYKYYVGDGVKKLMERILPKENVNEEEIEKLLKIHSSYYSKHYYDKTKPYDEIIELLNKLKEKKCKLAIVSNKSNNHTKEIVQNFFDEGLFDYVTGKKDGYEPKPDPALTKEAVLQLGVKTDECAFVGDSGMDMLTAIRAEVYPIGVTWGFRKRDELLKNGAKSLVDNPLEIVDIVAKLPT